MRASLPKVKAGRPASALIMIPVLGDLHRPHIAFARQAVRQPVFMVDPPWPPARQIVPHVLYLNQKGRAGTLTLASASQPKSTASHPSPDAGYERSARYRR